MPHPHLRPSASRPASDLYAAQVALARMPARPPAANTDIVVAVTAHLASELRRDRPVNLRIKLFWARAEALRSAAPHDRVKQAFFALAKRSGLISDLGRHGDEDVRHVLDWAVCGRIPFRRPR